MLSQTHLDQMLAISYLLKWMFISQSTQVLTEAEDQRVCEVLDEIADKVQKRRIMMYQYFKDFDRVRNLFIFGSLLIAIEIQ